MPRFCTGPWLDALAAAGRGVPVTGLPDDGTLVIEQHVTGGPDGDCTFHMVLSAGGIDVQDGPAPYADVRFTSDYATAAAVAAGTETVPDVFLAGRLRVGGDTTVLLGAREALAGLDDVFAGVRAETTY